MNILCIDDEPLVLDQTMTLCKQLPAVTSCEGFTSVTKALDYLANHQIDLVFLDIDMPDMNGITAAAKIKQLSPMTYIVFVTGYSQYAVDAFKLRASGYLLKPISLEQLNEEIAHIQDISVRLHSDTATSSSDDTDLNPAANSPCYNCKYKKEREIRIQTFGNFDVFVREECVAFERKKSKEILAYLVNMQGSSVSRSELASALWENDDYSHSIQKQLDVYIRSLRKTLKEYNISHIIEMNKGFLRVNPDTFTCDFYNFLSGDLEAINTYCGNYMNAYSWAEFSAGTLSQTKYNF